MLTIGSDQVNALADRRQQSSDNKVASYLRDAAADQAGALSVVQMDDHVRESREVGREFGLTSERAHAKWAYLMLMTNGEIARQPWVRPYLASPGSDANDRLDLLMRSLIAARQRLGDPS